MSINQRGQTFFTIGHRGAGGEKFENSLSGFQHALSLDLDAIELDIRIHSDELWVIHDDDLERLTGQPGHFGDLLDPAEVRLKNQEPIPRLREVLDLCWGKTPVNIEIKSFNTAAKLNDLLCEYPALEPNPTFPWILISSFDHRQILQLRDLDCPWALALLTHGIPMQLERDIEQLKPYSWHMHDEYLDYDLIKKIQAQGVRVMVYTVNDMNFASELKTAGINGIFTDYPSTCREINPAIGFDNRIDVSPLPSIQTLRRIRELSQFSDGQLRELANRLSIESASLNQRLIERGCVEHFGLYILSGSISTTTKDGDKLIFQSKSEGDLSTVAKLRPSLYDVDALEDTQYIKIRSSQLVGFAQQQEVSISDNIEVATIEQTPEEYELTVQLLKDITSGNINLPSLPEVALRIQEAFSKENIDAVELARIIQSDPAITAKLIMITNSAFYRGRAKIDTLQQAIVHIGLEATRKQVIIFVVKELFSSNSIDIKARMQYLWKHSRRVAAFSRVLAVKSGLFDPEQAQLAGLVHDLGEIAILQYIQDHDQQYEDDDTLMNAISNLRPQITSMLLSKWNFTNELITVAEESEDWFRNPSNDADLCDLILIAQYHSFIGTAELKKLPPAFKLPAFAKLGLKMDEPAQIMAFVNESKAEVEDLEKMLGNL